MLQTFNVREVVEKEVVGFGNGSIVYTPKKWLGKKVQVILEEKQLDISEEAMRILKPYLPHIQGVFLFGSHARGEETEQSDVDVLVITDKKSVVDGGGVFDFLLKTKSEFVKEVRVDPTLYLHHAINEAKPIFNESLLFELKQVPIKPDFKEFLEDTLGAFKRTKDLLDSYEGKEELKSNAVIYSLILRLRGLFIIQCFKKNKVFSNKKFCELLKSYGFSEQIVDGLMRVYRSERSEKNTGIKISVGDALHLFDVAKNEFIKTEKVI